MNNRRSTIRILALVIPALFFYLFSQSYLIRHLSLFFIALSVFATLYVIVIPRLIEVRRLDSVVRGIKFQEIAVRIQLRNTSPIPIPYFTLTDQTDGLFAEASSFGVSLRPFEKKTVVFNCKGHRRGEYSLGPVGLSGSDPLGVLLWKRRVETYLGAIVYPSIHRLDLTNERGLPAGNIHTHNRIYEDLTRFRSLREYVAGDDTRRINWKASAKTNRLYTMEFDAALYFPALILLNFSLDDYPARYRDLLIEQAAETAASLVFHFADLKQEIGFVTSGIFSSRDEPEASLLRIPARAGYESAREILEVIARLKTEGGSADFNDLLWRGNRSVPMGTRLAVVSPRLTESQSAALITAQRKGATVQVLLVESPLAGRNGAERGALSVISVPDVISG